MAKLFDSNDVDQAYSVAEEYRFDIELYLKKGAAPSADQIKAAGAAAAAAAPLRPKPSLSSDGAPMQPANRRLPSAVVAAPPSKK